MDKQTKELIKILERQGQYASICEILQNKEYEVKKENEIKM